MRARKTVIFLTIGFLVGISVLLYPAFSNYWNSKTSSRAIVDYEAVLQYMEPEDYSAIFQAAYDYNAALYQTEYPFRESVSSHQNGATVPATISAIRMQASTRER